MAKQLRTRQTFWGRTMGATLLALLTMMSGLQAQVTNTIYYDTFSRTGGLNGSTPSPVDSGNAAWTAFSQLITDGSEISVTNATPAGNYNNAFLPFTPQVGHVYTLSVDIKGTYGGNNWLAFGFAQNALMNHYYAGVNIGAGWMLQRANAQQAQAFLGPGTANQLPNVTEGGDTNNFITLSVVLNTITGTASSGWTVTYYTNGVQVAQGVYGSNPTILYVGVGAYSATGYYRNFRLTDYAGPIITQEPVASTNVVLNGTLVVPAAAVGNPAVAYQWYDSHNVPVPGQTNATLVISNIQVGGSYYLKVTNTLGSATSTPVAVDIITAPLITNDLPLQVALAQGQPYTYSLGVMGVQPISYQWYQNGSALLDQTNSSYSFFAGNVGAETYYAVASNLYGSATSAVSTLTILPSTPVRLTITNSPGYAIPDDFSGLGWEIRDQLPDMDGVSGSIFDPTNTQLITLFQNMGVRNLRIGAGSVDNTNFALLSDADIDRLFGFAQAAGLKVNYGLRLLNGNANTNAVMAQYVWQNYQLLVDKFSIGNEPEYYGWSYSTYLNTWNNFHSIISAAVPGAGFVGPDTLNNYWAGQFANSENGSGRVAEITQHEYWGGSSTGVTADMAVSNMLSPRWVNTLYPNAYNSLSSVIADGYPYRFTEMNDYLGGITNASDAFAAALWALDVMHWWAAKGAAGINFHNNEWIRTDTIFLDGNGNFQVHPKAYGIKAWDLGGHGSVEPVVMNNPNGLNLTAYAVADPANLYVTLINKEYGANAHNAAVTMQLNGFQPGGVAAMYLTVADGNVEATNGVTLGGAYITNNAPWQGQWTALGAVSNGQFTVTVPAASAAVVRMAVTPAELAAERLGASQVRLTWKLGVLQSATNVTGPYNDVSNASSPYTTTMTNAQVFYRIRGN